MANVPRAGAVSLSVPVLGGVGPAFDRSSQPVSDDGVAVNVPGCPPEDSWTTCVRVSRVKETVVGETISTPGTGEGGVGELVSAGGTM